MPKNFNWLEDFAKEYASKTSMTKVASTTKVAKEQVIIDPSKVPHCQNGDVVSYNGVKYTIVNASFSDNKGPGVVLERTAAVDDLLEDDAAGAPTPDESADAAAVTGVPEVTTPEATAAPGDMGAQEYARRNPGDIYHYEVRDDVEQPSFMQAAEDTMNDIKGDWNVDRTSVDGHYTNPNTEMPGAGTTPGTQAPIGTSVAQPAPAQAPVGAQPAQAQPVDAGLEATAAANGDGPDVPVASNSQVTGYGYGASASEQVDPTAPVADMAAQDQKVGFDVGEDWVDPTGHGTGDPTPKVNVPEDVAGDQYPGATHSETPAFVQQVNQSQPATPVANPATVDAPAQRLDAATAPAAQPVAPVDTPAQPDAEDSAQAQPVADDKADANKAPADDKAEGEDLKENRIAARIAKMLRK